MTAVFSHGRLRLYLLKLLDDGPKHGYEFIRLLEQRFQGSYVPSAGTIYPRLQRLETEGLVAHTAAGGRKTYRITDAGRAELHQRAGELTTIESEITASVRQLADLADEIRAEVRGSVRDLRRELQDAARQSRAAGAGRLPRPPAPPPPAAYDPDLDLDRRVAAFAAQVRGLAHGAQLTEEQLRAAGAALDATLQHLRQLLRG